MMVPTVDNPCTKKKMGLIILQIAPFLVLVLQYL